MENGQGKKWLAFISYSHVDIKWAEWLQQKLEFYKLPNFVAEEYPEKPKWIRPIFRDVTDLEVGVLPEKITEALQDSQFLIVICSPRSAVSKWVNMEVSTFIELGKERKIIPFVVDGETDATKVENECLPPALRSLRDRKELYGCNVKELSRDYAAVKVVAAMLELRVDQLWQRYLEAEEKEKQRLIEERNHLLRVQSHYLAERSFYLSENGDTDVAKLIALEALPKCLEEPDRPYVREAEAALRYACLTYNRALSGHTEEINSIVYSSDGQHLVSSSFNETIVWDVHSGRQLESFKETETFFSPDGECFLLTRSYHNVEVWSYYPRKLISRIGDVLALNNNKYFNYGHKELSCSGVSFSCDHKYVIVSVNCSSGDSIVNNQYSLKIFDTCTGKIIRTIETEGMFVLSPVISPDKRFVAATNEKEINVWDFETGELLWNLTGHTARISGLTFSPDSSLLASCSLYDEQSIKLWDMATGELERTLTGHEDNIYSVHFNSDGDFLISASHDGTVRLWNIADDSCTTYEIGSSAFRDAVLSPDGKSIVAGGLERQLNVIFLNYGSQYVMVGGRPYFIENGKKAITLCQNSFAFYDTASGKLIDMKDITKEGMIITLSHDGKYVVTSHYLQDGSKEWMLRDIDSYSRLRTLDRGHCIQSVDFSPIENIYVIVEDSIMIVDTETGHVLRSLINPDNRSVVFSEGPYYGQRVLSGEAHFSKDGRYVFFDYYSIIDIWDVQQGVLVWTYSQSIMGVKNFCYDIYPESMLFAAKDGGNIKIWDIRKNELIHDIYAHVEDIMSLAFSPDGRWLVSAGMDKNIRIWDVETGELFFGLNSLPYYGFEGENFELDKVMFSPDGHQIFCSSGITTVVWAFPLLQQLIDETRELYKDRPLTPGERRKFYLE